MFTEMPINDTFISALYKKKSDYNNPDQATTQEQSLIQLSSGIYTEEERFVFELFQNAVDAFENSTGCLNVKIAIQNGYLVFMHNGQAFSERDIEGLCDVGNGNKTKDIKKIGYKGIGFKSVFWSSCVTVFSGGYCFKFDPDVELALKQACVWTKFRSFPIFINAFVLTMWLSTKVVILKCMSED